MSLLFYFPYTCICYIPVFTGSLVNRLGNELMDFATIFEYLLNFTLIRFMVDVLKLVLEFMSDIVVAFLGFCFRVVLYLLLALAIFFPCACGIFFWGNVAYMWNSFKKWCKDTLDETVKGIQKGTYDHDRQPIRA